MSADIIVFKGASAPPVELTFPQIPDITGLDLVIEIQATAASVPVSFDLTIDGQVAKWDYTASDIQDFPTNRSATYDIWEGTGGDRRKLAGGRLQVLGRGMFYEVGAIQIVSGPPGPPGPGVNVIVVEDADWPPDPDSNPINWYVRAV